jgi:CheY-like chemotaxis protein
MGHSCVLVVDDDADIREAVADALREFGYQVQEAENGAVALDEMRADPPCVVLLDLMMPVLGGWEVVQAMEQDPRLASIPVCVLSAMPDRAPRECATVLEKPVAMLRLLSAVERHCGCADHRPAARP